jgi:hypothetical protein
MRAVELSAANPNVDVLSSKSRFLVRRNRHDDRIPISETGISDGIV